MGSGAANDVRAVINNATGSKILRELLMRKLFRNRPRGLTCGGICQIHFLKKRSIPERKKRVVKNLIKLLKNQIVVCLGYKNSVPLY
jgi:hypothetical protein